MELLFIIVITLGIFIFLGIYIFKQNKKLVKMKKRLTLAEKEAEKYKSEIQEINDELKSLSYAVSHDLRVPLRAIDGFSLILLEEYTDRLDDEGKRQLHVVRENTEKMRQLIDDLLAFSRAGRQEVMKSEIIMDELAKKLMTILDQNDVVLLKGSRGMKMESILELIKE